KNAIEGNASDIHIENTGEKVKVRFRVDGVLHTTIVLPTTVYSGVVARIKILGKLRLDEKRKPQDGSFSADIDGRKIDFRVSIMLIACWRAGLLVRPALVLLIAGIWKAFRCGTAEQSRPLSCPSSQPYTGIWCYTLCIPIARQARFPDW